MLKRIDKAFETEKIILSEASHKLKTPIAVIKSYCDVILKKERSKEEYIETITSIKSVTNKIVSLISGILSIAKLESENIKYNKFEKISINECINNCLDLVEYLAYQKNIDIKIENNSDYYILADKDKIIEALINIIENAIKYNSNNGEVLIKTFKEDNFINISIKDSGKGINDEEKDKIFDKFYRINDNKNVEGNGLGLNISKTIIESHQGKIKVNSNINNQGTEFIISLPIWYYIYSISLKNSLDISYKQKYSLKLSIKFVITLYTKCIIIYG